MQEQVNMNQKTFQKMERDLLDQIMDVSKSMIETFKFKLIYDSKVSKQQSDSTIKALKEFRSKNWDDSSSKNEAYKKYISRY